TVTQLLLEWRQGNQAARDELIRVVYHELRRLARQHLRRERAGHTLQTTALVHEAYIQLVGQRKVEWQNRAHFFGIAAQLMRRILVEYARRRSAAKHGGGLPAVTVDAEVNCGAFQDASVLALDEALKTLETLDPQQSRIVELRFFGGLSVDEVA